jgi:predicted HTH domain antitoxin
MDEFELRLELACALYARRRISAVAGSRLAGIALAAMDRILGV